MSKSIIIAVLGSSITLIFSIFTSSAPVNASFCIFDCAAVDLETRLQANADCIRDQIMMGNPGRTAYGTEDLSSDGNIITIDGVQYTEDELKNEWKENPDRHSSNCYFIADITPQEVERVYQESLK
jgi:hypothetical protein